MASKREREEDPNELVIGETMSIMPIGAGNEVGRSCIILKYMGKTIMLDCGIHPGFNGMAALPFFDEIEPSEIDLLLITHFHLDHAASLPYFTEHTGFTGKIFMTHPTKAVMRMLLLDYIKLVNVSSEDILYDEQDLSRCIEKIELIDFHQVLEHEGIKFWCYNAGHVLGAAMFMIEIAGVHILYTGDYSMEDDRHLMAAEIPSTSPDVLIVESTYGVQIHSPREEREERFTSTVANVVRRGGRCLIPVFALGRAQELLLILDEFWQANKDLHHIPIYYASRLASKAIRVYQTYINMMNHHIRRQMDVANPFRFQHITNLKNIDKDFDDMGPSVVMASPGMLQSGVSRQLFDRWCADDKNGVLIPGYSVEGTLAKKILSSPDEVTGLDGRVRPLRCSVDYISFSAHVDYVENKRFMDAVAPSKIILVHGEANEMMRLKGELVRKYMRLPAEERPEVLAPRNCQSVTFEFRRDKMAKAVGPLTLTLPTAASMGGILVNKDFNNRLMAPSDLETYTQLKVGGVHQKLKVPFYSSFEALRLFFNEVYDEVIAEKGVGGSERLLVHGAAVTVDFYPSQPTRDAPKTSELVKQQSVVEGTGMTGASLVFEWEASPVNDMIADSLVALAMQAQTSPGGIRLTTAKTQKCKHGHNHVPSTSEGDESGSQVPTPEEIHEAGVRSGLAAALSMVGTVLKDSYGTRGVSIDEATNTLCVSLDQTEHVDSADSKAVAEPQAKVALVSKEGGAWGAVVTCEDQTLSTILNDTMRRLQAAQ